MEFPTRHSALRIQHLKWLPRMDSHHQHPVSETGVLLLNYRASLKLAEGVGNAPTLAQSQSCFRDRRSQLISACLPIGAA